MTKEEGLALLRLARASIAGKFRKHDVDVKPIPHGISQGVLDRKQGVFVTLHQQGKLRGCIGNIEPVKTLGAGVRENALHAAFQDSRFSPLTQDELDAVDIEISILTVPVKMAYKTPQELVSKLVPGVDGVILEKNHHRATFLPQVWEQLPTPQAFLSQLCIKAGLAGHAWEKGDLTIHTYQVQSFGEEKKR